jgi:hypothetical protein
MKSRTIARGLLAGFALAGAAAPAGAQELLENPPAGNDHVWDCWVSQDWTPAATYLIRCIHDRDVPPPEPAPDSPEAILLDHVHELIHQGDSLQLDAEVRYGLLTELAGHVWQIRIHQYPYEESWKEGRPQMLVQRLLCPSTPDCPVMIQR